MIILYAEPISFWPLLGKKTGIFILGTLTIMTVDNIVINLIAITEDPFTLGSTLEITISGHYLLDL